MYTKRMLITCITACALLSLVAACTPASALSQPEAPALTPGVIQVTGTLTIQDGRTLAYGLLVPQSWTGKYEIRTEGNIAFFDYKTKPQHALFSIAAFSEAQWQEARQEPGGGIEILSQDGIVLVYNVALDNPYTGSTAEEFQGMTGQVKSLIGSLTASIAPLTEPEKASAALETFFERLSKGNYAEAVGLYGGSYETLVAFNPEVEADDTITLWTNGCRVNGLQCLPTRSVTFVERKANGEYIFSVEFNNPDGSLFVLGTCCGEERTNTAPVSQFEYHVAQGGDGIYQVLDMPVYVP